jgi:hypothetical protein
MDIIIGGGVNPERTVDNAFPGVNKDIHCTKYRDDKPQTLSTEMITGDAKYRDDNAQMLSTEMITRRC